MSRVSPYEEFYLIWRNLARTGAGGRTGLLQTLGVGCLTIAAEVHFAKASPPCGCASEEGSLLLDTAARARHNWQIWLPGTGKTKLLELLALLDGLAGRGCCVIDLHKDLMRNLIFHCAHCLPEYPHLKDRLIILDPTLPSVSASFNPLAPGPGITPEQQADVFQDVAMML